MVYCAASMVPSSERVHVFRLGSVLLGAVLICCFLFTEQVGAQVIGGPRPTPVSEAVKGFLTRYDVHVTGDRVTGDGQSQFKWDPDIGVDMDVFDLERIRGNVFMNVETMIGDERRAIDPNQSAYTFDLSVFTRLPRGEFGTTFHHISRHRSDRQLSLIHI